MFLQQILGYLGALLGLFLQLSPMPSMIVGLKKREIKSMTISYFIVGCMQASFWISYGFGINDPVVWSQNVSCFGLFLFYMNIIVYIGTNKMMFLYTNVGLLILLFFSIKFIPPNISVCAATVIAVCWQSTNFENIKKALDSKDHERINSLVSYVTSCAFLCMWIYSLMISAFVMFIPNFYGFILNLINLLIYHWALGRINDNNIIIIILKKIFRVEDNANISNYSNIENINCDKRQLYDNLNNIKNNEEVENKET